jgi:hypothetical protein
VEGRLAGLVGQSAQRAAVVEVRVPHGVRALLTHDRLRLGTQKREPPAPKAKQGQNLRAYWESS